MENTFSNMILFAQTADTSGYHPFWGIFGVWLAGLLTLAMYSFLYKDNPVYKFAEHLYLGISVGFYINVTWWQSMKPLLFDPLMHDFGYNAMLLIPGILGITMFFRFSRSLAWVSRYALAYYVAAGAGMAIPAIMQASILRQLDSTFVPLWGAGTTGFVPVLSAILVFIGVLSVLVYFFFSMEHKGVVGKVSQVGIWFLMITFGASFGYTVMARISLLIGRMQFLLEEWMGVTLG